MDHDEIGSLFEMIDVTECGSLTPHEFVDGLFRMKGPATARHVFEVHCEMQKLRRYIQVLLGMNKHYEKRLISIKSECFQGRSAISRLESRVIALFELLCKH